MMCAAFCKISVRYQTCDFTKGCTFGVGTMSKLQDNKSLVQAMAWGNTMSPESMLTQLLINVSSSPQSSVFTLSNDTIACKENICQFVTGLNQHHHQTKLKHPVSQYTDFMAYMHPGLYGISFSIWNKHPGNICNLFNNVILTHWEKF